jgi:uncharacterized membrane protein YgdD (TMEM256/DUF423 family)
MRRFAFPGAAQVGAIVIGMGMPDGWRRALASTGALLATASVALAAYAAHGTVAGDRSLLQLAAVFALVHGAAVVALARTAPRRTGAAALALLLLGSVLFSGSLALAHWAGLAPRLAPAGGLLLLSGWLLLAVDAGRR